MHFLNILQKSCTEELVRQTSSRPQEEEVDCEKAEKESGGDSESEESSDESEAR